MIPFIGRVHDVNINEREHTTTKLDATIAANLKELGYDR